MPFASDPGQVDLTGNQPKLRATQTIVSHMAYGWSHPSLIFIEVAWRWLFGIPFVWVVWIQAQQILERIPPESVGLDRLDFQNPWLSSVLLAEAFSRYEVPVSHVLHWVLPAAIAGFGIFSGVGRCFLLRRMFLLDGENRAFTSKIVSRIPGYIVLQAIWALALCGCFWLWYRAVGWASATHITVGAQPDLVGYLCWLIFLSLGIYTLWALASWTLASAPLWLVLGANQANSSWLGALAQSFRLGKTLSSKLLEISLVLAIVKIMLIVLDMVFSAAPLPFADQFGPDALHVLYVAVFMGFLLANDFFHVVRLRAFVELWRYYRLPKV